MVIFHSYEFYFRRIAFESNGQAPLISFISNHKTYRGQFRNLLQWTVAIWFTKFNENLNLFPTLFCAFCSNNKIIKILKDNLTQRCVCIPFHGTQITSDVSEIYTFISHTLHEHSLFNIIPKQFIIIINNYPWVMRWYRYKRTRYIYVCRYETALKL